MAFREEFAHAEWGQKESAAHIKKSYDEAMEELQGAIHSMEVMNELPECRSRKLSLAITNAQQALLWLRDDAMDKPEGG